MKELKKQHLEMLQLLESIEVMLQNGDSIHPNSVIRGAIQTSIGMEVDVTNVNDKFNTITKTAVEWLENEFQEICKDFGGLHSDFIVKFDQAKEIDKYQKNQMYNEIEVLQLLLKLLQTESFDNLKEWFEQNKKCYHPLTERKHTSDTHFECTICGYNTY